MNVKLLLDENISPKVAEVLGRDGLRVAGDGSMSFETMPPPK